MKDKLVAYKRSNESPWVVVPRMTRRGLALFVAMGTYFALKFENRDGLEVIEIRK